MASMVVGPPQVLFVDRVQHRLALVLMHRAEASARMRSRSSCGTSLINRFETLATSANAIAQMNAFEEITEGEVVDIPGGR